MVNKTNGVCFTAADENLFKTFSVYCALALHYTRLHNKMLKTVLTDLIQNIEQPKEYTGPISIYLLFKNIYCSVFNILVYSTIVARSKIIYYSTSCYSRR